MSDHLRVTALGSYGGTDMPGTIDLVLSGLPDLPHLPELPQRGAPAQMVGRSGALLDGLALDLQPSGWRVAATPDAAAKQARSLLRRDLDDLEEQAQGYQGPMTVAFAGPWTLAAEIQLHRGAPVLSDHGARRELAASLAQGVSTLLAELARRLPQITWHVQLDEPMLVAVQRGRVPTSSGFGRLRSVSDSELASALRSITQPYPGATVHSCAQEFGPGLARRSDLTSVSLDATRLRTDEVEQWGEWVAAGGSVLLGILDSAAAGPQSADHLAQRARRIVDMWSLEPAQLRERVWLTPSCGLAGWTLTQAAAGLRALRSAAAQLDDEWGEG